MRNARTIFMIENEEWKQILKDLEAPTQDDIRSIVPWG
jgi:hypothetical protein